MKSSNKLIGYAKLFYRLYRMTGKKFFSKASAANGYLKQTGWIRSEIENRIVDEHGNPVPWCTYPFVSFIGERLDPKMTVFEYGAGYSALFYSSRVKQVTSVETDKYWFEILKNDFFEQEIKNVDIHFSQTTQELSSFINKVGQEFDIIII